VAAQQEEPERERADEASEPEAEEHRSEEESEPDTEEAGEPEPRSGGGWSLKRLSGPQACLGIVGCGTLAAVVVVALVFGGIRLVAGAFTSEEADANAGEPVPERSPRETTEPGVLDVCAIGVEASGVLTNLNRADSGDDPVDSATLQPADPEGYRVVEDECEWSLGTGSGNTMKLVFSYSAIMDAESTGARTVVVEDSLEELRDEVEGSFSPIDDRGELDGMGLDEASWYFVQADDQSGGPRYALVGRVKSAVFQLGVQDAEEDLQGEPSAREDLESVVLEVLPYIQTNFERQVPD
jgi:hypothetical protein